MSNKSINVLLYGVDDKEKLKPVSLMRDRQNYRAVKTMSFLMILILSVMVIVTMITPKDYYFAFKRDNLSIFVIGLLLSCAALILSEKLKSLPTAFVYLLVYTEATIVYVVLGYLGVYAVKNENAVLFNLALVAISVLISDHPYRIAIYNLVVCITFLVASYMIKDPQHFGMDRLNLAISFIIAVSLAVSTQFTRISDWGNKVVLEKELFLDHFINKMIEHAGSADTPDHIIRNIVEYIGKELQADRAYVFEGDKGERYDNTFEWCNKSVTPLKENFQDVPYKGVIEPLFESLENSKIVVISDPEKCSKEMPGLYELIHNRGIKNLVAGPIRINEEIIGFYGVDNINAADLDEVADIIGYAEFFFSVIFQFRNQTNQIREVSYHDQLTGLKNRHALMESCEQDKDDKSLAVIMFDVNGLKIMNDSFGHKAGDDLLVRAARSLVEVFGEESVYRMGGDEYLVFDKKINEEEMNQKIEKLREVLKTNDVSMSLGALYLDNAELPIDELIKMSDAMMYEEKKRYYEQGAVDRRGRR